MNFKELLACVRELGMQGWVIGGLVLCSIASTLAEGLGIGLILPIAQLMTSGNDPQTLIDHSRLWQYIDRAHLALGLSVSLQSLFTACGILLIIRQMIVYIREVFFNAVKFRLICDNQISLLRAFLGSLADYQDKIQVGDMANEMVTELNRAVTSIFSLGILISFALQIPFYFGFMMLLSWQMTLAAAGGLAIIGFFLQGFMRRTEHAGHSVADANRKIAVHFVERLSQARLIRLCNMARAEHEKMSEYALQQRFHNNEVALLQARVSSLIEPLVMLSGITAVYFGHTVLELGLAELGMFLIITFRLLPVFRTLLLTRQSYFANLASLRIIINRMRELAASQETDAIGVGSFPQMQNGIEFKNVDFVYVTSGEVTALQDVSLRFPAGKISAIVGPSGSGKSTLVDMIPRIRRPQKGQVLFDETPADRIALDDLRAQVAYVPQTPIMLDVTIAEHIRFGKPDASDEEVREAAELAGIEEFIETLPESYDSRIGASGGRLSGGQRQRIDLARALISPAQILILDEPTSSLDADLEYRFTIKLDEIRRQGGRTIIVVGHRFVTTRSADNLIVMRDGTVDAVGNHESLMVQNGWYAQAYNKQMG
jgi:ABC-type multidrug transport system fused ATPase/permease subunit